jgi:hypothetical protein
MSKLGLWQRTLRFDSSAGGVQNPRRGAVKAPLLPICRAPKQPAAPGGAA